MNRLCVPGSVVQPARAPVSPSLKLGTSLALRILEVTIGCSIGGGGGEREVSIYQVLQALGAPRDLLSVPK